MKADVWNWTKVVAIVPVAWLLAVIMSPLIAVLATYDLVLLGWRSGK